MQIHQISRPASNRKAQQVGRGGKRGKTSGRGGKGQTARAGNKRRPELRDMIKKLPKKRGYGKNRAMTVNPEGLNPVTLPIVRLQGKFKSGDKITPAILVEKGVVSKVSGRLPRVKIVGNTKIDGSFKFENILASAGARKIIEDAGGNIA